jgi:hypothetical protein
MYRTRTGLLNNKLKVNPGCESIKTNCTARYFLSKLANNRTSIESKALGVDFDFIIMANIYINNSIYVKLEWHILHNVREKRNRKSKFHVPGY